MANEAKAGDPITAKARAKLAKVSRVPADQIADKVAPKTTGQSGQWFCITCGELPRNNLEASGHTKNHKVAWRSFDSGQIEAP